MFKFIFTIVFISLNLLSSTLVEKRWPKGETFLTFLEKNRLPLSIYYNLDKEEQELATEIISGVKFQILRDENGKLEQALIPIGEELQLHLIKLKDGYKLITTPISFQEEDKKATIEVTSSPYQDIIKQTGNYLLAHEFMQAFKNSVNFKRLRKGDRVVIFYKKRIRLGRQFSPPKIEAAMVEIRGRKNYVFRYNNGRYYDDKGKEVEGFFLAKPVNYKRISSRFTYKRWHPILKKYRAHLGVDFAANPGTPVRAAGRGKIIYRARKGGYGKTVIIKHDNGYKTLYAHMRAFNKHAKRGKWVKKGQIIGYVGSTGLSSGPHLHFGLYKRNRAVNPFSVVKVTKSRLSGKKRKEFFVQMKKYKDEIEVALKEKYSPKKIESFDYIVSLEKPILDKVSN